MAHITVPIQCRHRSHQLIYVHGMTVITEKMAHMFRVICAARRIIFALKLPQAQVQPQEILMLLVFRVIVAQLT